MLYGNPAIQLESANLPLFRYMDDFKFNDFLETGTLYFSRADGLLDYDKNEGFLSNVELQHYLDSMYGDGLFDSILQGTQGLTNIRFGDYKMTFDKKQDLMVIQEMVKNNLELFKKWIFINCWNIGEHESDSMWHRYVKSSESVAIKTTLDNLKDSNKQCENQIYCQKIDYLTSNDTNTYKFRVDKYYKGLPLLFFIIRLFFDKKIEFRHDDELRLLYVDTETFSDNSSAIYAGIELDGYEVRNDNHKFIFDPNIVIEQIILHPKATSQYKGKVIEKLETLGYANLIPKIVSSALC